MQTKLVKPTHDNFIIAGDQTFHVLQWGEQGPAIIFIHGITANAFEEYVQRLKAAPFLGSYWNEYVDRYFEHDVFRNPDGSVVSKCYREGILEDGYRLFENRPEEQWRQVNVPTLLLRAGQGLFSDNDQLLPVESALAIKRNIKNCRFFDFPELNHYTIVFSADSALLWEVRRFVDEEV